MLYAIKKDHAEEAVQLSTCGTEADEGDYAI